MPITSSSPITVDPIPAPVVYDTWWIARLFIQSDDAIKPTTATVVYRLGRMDSTTGAFVPFIDDNGDFTERLLYVPDLFALAATDSGVNATITQIITTAGDLGKSQNVIS
jgi:hypothetical protein